MNVRTLVLSVVILFSTTGYLFTSCSSDAKPATLKSDATANSPEEELAGFKVPDDFIIELVASEKEGVINPIDITFDDAGRLWTQTAGMYPLDPIADIKWDDLLELMNDQEKQRNHPNFKRIHDLYTGKTKGTDKIIVLSDFYNYDDPSVKSEVWADGLTIPMSIMPYKNGAYVAQGSELFFLEDSDRDGKSDKRRPMFTGFGFTDTHTMAHCLIRGPGGWLYFSHGALNKGEVTSYATNDLKVKMDYSKIARFTDDAKKMELVTPGLNNIWGFQLRNNGQWYITEANDLGFSVVPLDPGSAFRGIGNDRFRPYQPWMPELFKFRVGGTGISGLAFADDATNSFPGEWKNVAFLANPITSTINAVKVMRNPDGTVSGEHLSDFLVSEDKFFRPVNMEFGPDGCLYIADWYNKIISHNEVPTTHPDRDKTHGRIWRIRHKNQQPHKVTDYTKVPTDQLVEGLKSPSLWAKRAAWHQIIDRPTSETSKLAAALVTLAGDAAQDEVTRIHAVWSLEGLGHYDEALTKTILAGQGDNLRRETIRSLASFSLTPAGVAAAIGALINDPNPMIRSQVLRTLNELGKADSSVIAILVQACKPELAGNDMGGAYERRFERYLALKALEQYRAELSSYISSGANIPPANLLWVAHALPNDQRDKKFLEAWPAAQLDEFHESDFVMTLNMIDNPRVYAAVKPVVGNPAHTVKYLRYALANQQQVQSKKLPEMLAPIATRLLKSDSASHVQLALDAIGRLEIKAPRESIRALINEQAPNNTVRLAIKVLENEPEQNKEVFRKVFTNDRFNFEVRLTALNSLAKADQKEASQLSKTWLSSLKDEQKETFASVLSGSGHGATLLKNLYTEKLIGNNAFSLSAAERVRDADPKDQNGLAIYQAVEKRMEEERKIFNERLKKYMAIAEKNNGDAAKGKALFQTCLMCHKVGDKGQDIAPALDGSAARENEALLTAILNPDAAVERGYELFRVTKNDNTVIEGYLYQRDGNGMTIANMGGTKTFIPAAEIKSFGFLGGRSFMPKGLTDNYSDADVANLVAFIRTLK